MNTNQGANPTYNTAAKLKEWVDAAIEREQDEYDSEALCAIRSVIEEVVASEATIIEGITSAVFINEDSDICIGLFPTDQLQQLDVVPLDVLCEDATRLVEQYRQQQMEQYGDWLKERDDDPGTIDHVAECLGELLRKTNQPLH